MIVTTVGTCLSIICSVVLVVVWCTNEKWRTIHNFINIHQIAIGTVHLCALRSGILELDDHLFLLSLCWSVCATLLAYSKLVLLIPDKISYEKRIALMFSNGTFIIAEGVLFLIPRVYEEDYDILVPYVIFVGLFMTFNLLTLLRVIFAVLSCCKRKISRTGGMRIISVVGIAVLCDMLVVTFLVTILIEMLTGVDLFSVAFNFRLVPHTLIILANRSSMDYWKKMIRKRKQRASNRMI